MESSKNHKICSSSQNSSRTQNTRRNPQARNNQNEHYNYPNYNRGFNPYNQYQMNQQLYYGHPMTYYNSNYNFNEPQYSCYNNYYGNQNYGNQNYGNQNYGNQNYAHQNDVHQNYAHHASQGSSSDSNVQTHGSDVQVVDGATANVHQSNENVKKKNYERKDKLNFKYTKKQINKNNEQKYKKPNDESKKENQKSNSNHTRVKNHNHNHNHNHNRKARNFENDENQREMLDEQLRKGEYECMVCCEEVRIRDAIWSCYHCFNIFHLKCIKTWANSESALSTEPNSSSSNQRNQAWRCPACQNSHQKIPNRYFCFCGKTREPELNRYLVPHSCGELCQKKRKEQTQQQRKYCCMHKCNLLCHPGPCPPCEAKVIRKCACEKTEKIVSCATNDEDVECTNVCGKTLNCSIHQCEEFCHFGDCPECQIRVVQTCYCGKEKREVKCSESKENKFNCGNKCNKPLSCKNHECQETCHEGDCLPCLYDPQFISVCPCGKTDLKHLTNRKRKSCLDSIATCSNVCGKALNCGTNSERHQCKSKCHIGPCPPCPQKSIIRCRCGANSKSINCNQLSKEDGLEFVCKKRCNKKKQCGRHKCLNECCIDTDHQCQQICGRKLSCGTHTCQELCHFSKCHSCWNVSWEELSCRCGNSVILPPVACGSKRPECVELCNRIHPCGHPITHNCHDDMTCPPCTFLVSKTCYGQHEKRAAIPCYQDGVSCGFICNRPMSCGLHHCQMICHPGDCGKCTLPCTKKRTDCGHPCGLTCHQKTSLTCPISKCKTTLKVTCPCGRKSDTMPCHRINEEANRLPAKLLAQTRIKAGESVNVSDILKSVQENKLCRLKCDDVCSVVERNKQLAEALDIKDADFSPDPGPPNYSELLKDAALNEPKFVSDVYEILSKLVIESKQCKLSFKNYNFPPMNSNQRHIIHELAEFFGCKSHAIDKEPNRSVVVKATVGKCYLPTISVMDIVKQNNRISTTTKIKLINCSFDDKEIKSKEQSNDEGIKTSKDKEKIDYFDFST